MTDDFTTEDMAAIRRQGDHRDFIRHLVASRSKPAPEPPTQPHRPGSHHSGAWPIGTHPPGPLPAQPPGTWDAAVAEFRALNRRRPGYLYAVQRCECGCDPEAKDT